MKYEAKCSNANGQLCPSTDTPTSIAEGTPWVHRNQAEAAAECTKIPGAQLISNDQWMTIATNIANKASNWSGSSVGLGALNRGHNSYGSLAMAATVGEGSNDQKRTHTLSNGEVIWDMAGNVWEWIKPEAIGCEQMSAGSTWVEFDQVSGGNQSKTDFIPQVAITEGWNSDQGMGRYYAGQASSYCHDHLLRGAGASNSMFGWSTYSNSSGANAGVFTAALFYDGSESRNHIGFRCVNTAP